MSKKLVCGVGIKDCNEPIARENGDGTLWKCPFYTKWSNVLLRVFDLSFQAKCPTYKGCTIDPLWLIFSNFRSWMQTQDWEGKEIDKDILVEGNKHYGPDTCCFVSRAVNTFLIDSAAIRGPYPLGVRRMGNKFHARCNNPFLGKLEHLGSYQTPDAAYKAWRSYKHALACLYANQESNPRIANALRTRFVNPPETTPPKQLVKEEDLQA